MFMVKIPIEKKNSLSHKSEGPITEFWQFTRRLGTSANFRTIQGDLFIIRLWLIRWGYHVLSLTQPLCHSNGQIRTIWATKN